MRNENEQVFKIPGLNWKSVAGLFVFLIAVVISCYMTFDSSRLLVPIAISLVVFTLIFVLLSTTKAKLSGDRLIVGGALYKVSLPLAKIDVAGIRSLDAKDPFKLRWRLNGMGWPGLNLGWFSSNGQKRMFVAATNKTHRVYIPTAEKYDILVTPVDPASFVDAIQKRAKDLSGNASG